MLETRLILDIAIAICVVEAIVLASRFHLTARGLPTHHWISNLVSGVLLMLGLRWGAQELNPVMIQVGLLLSGIFHWIDLFVRHQQYAQSLAAEESSIQSGPSVYATKINPVM